MVCLELQLSPKLVYEVRSVTRSNIFCFVLIFVTLTRLCSENPAKMLSASFSTSCYSSCKINVLVGAEVIIC